MRFKPVVETETGWSDWILPTPRHPYRMACCDCGLVHDMEFEAIEVKRKRGGWTEVLGVLDWNKNWFRMRARRNDRLTKQVRDAERPEDQPE